MKSYWLVPGTTGPALLELRETPRPEAGQGQLLVAVRATCFNRGELLAHPSAGTAAKPAGIECAGEIAGIGAGVTGFAIGERIMGRCTGGFADYTVFDARDVLRIPARLSFEEAAAIPLAFMVADDMLVTHGRLAAGEWLLVTAVSSGVGVACLQAAKALGARVIGTSGSTTKLATLERELGLDVGIATRGGGFLETVLGATGGKGVNLVVNNVGGTVFAECVKSLAYEGRLATVGYLDGTFKAEIDLEALHTKRLHLFGVSNKLRPAADRVQTVRAFERDFLPLFADGRLKPVVDRVFSFDDVPAARAYLDSNAMIGKVVVRR